MLLIQFSQIVKGRYYLNPAKNFDRLVFQIPVDRLYHNGVSWCQWHLVWRQEWWLWWKKGITGKHTEPILGEIARSFLFAAAMRSTQLSRHCRALQPLLTLIQELQPDTNLPLSVMFQKGGLFIFRFYLLSDVNTAMMIRDGVFMYFRL